MFVFYPVQTLAISRTNARTWVYSVWCERVRFFFCVYIDFHRVWWFFIGLVKHFGWNVFENLFDFSAFIHWMCTWHLTIKSIYTWLLSRFYRLSRLVRVMVYSVFAQTFFIFFFFENELPSIIEWTWTEKQKKILPTTKKKTNRKKNKKKWKIKCSEYQE